MTFSRVEPNIERLKPYTPGKPVSELKRELGITRAIKLASNENPLGPSPLAVQHLREVSLDLLHFYPDGGAYHLKQALARHLNVSPDTLLVANGSNEAINLIVKTFRAPGCEAVLSRHSFIMYKIACDALNIPARELPMTSEYRFDLDAMADAITPATRFIFIANPNNPTGTYVSRDALARFLDRVPSHVLVVLDEAYAEYVQLDDYPNGIAMQARHPNLIILRTFSKCYGLAGLRVGYAVAHPDIIKHINCVREPFNVGVAAQQGACAALGDRDFLSRSVTHNDRERPHLEQGLQRLGLSITNSVANFVLFACPRPATEVYQALLQSGVIVRPMLAYDLPDHLRVSVGLREDIDTFLKALEPLL